VRTAEDRSRSEVIAMRTIMTATITKDELMR
jgi:hypothetical protein